MEKLYLKDLSFVNESGREVILHGLNVLCRGRETGHIYPELEKAFPWFRKMGFNLLRYGIFWDAAEPEEPVGFAPSLSRASRVCAPAMPSASRPFAA